ncbi:MAG TPA: hypothetical protein VMN37_06385 [Gemmatimonadales bacterium]|nr:hypothetical protein [Gemmatimonadales bacterium]
MMGCLTAPFRLLGCLGLLAALVLGWLYRDLVLREGRRLIAGGPAAVSDEAATGRPGVRGLASARAKVDSLTRGRADSVVLTPGEVASLVGSGLDPSLRRELDSLQVRLLDEEIALLARLRTGRLSRQAVGPLVMLLRDTEPIEAAGPIRVVASGRGEWRVRSFRVRGFPVPTDLVPGLVARALGGMPEEPLPVKVPAGISEIRVQPGSATLYGVPRE